MTWVDDGAQAAGQLPQQQEVRLGDRTTAPMLFCARCSNLLYPEADEERNMRWRCNYCKTTEVHDDCNMVYVLNMKMKSDTVGDTDLLAEFASDPTAQRDANKRCPRCEQNDVTCFVNPLGQPQEDMTLYFACANPKCRYVWKSEEVTEQV